MINKKSNKTFKTTLFLLKIIFISFLPLVSLSQQIFHGTVVSKEDNKIKIPYATIALMKENKGVNADENGNFNLYINVNNGDTLIVSSIGYQTLKLSVENLPLNLKFELQTKKSILEEVVIFGNNKNTSTLNDFSNCGINYYTSSGYITQMAQHFKSSEPNFQISAINICKQGDKSLFRIRIYSMESITRKPSIDLIDTIIEVKSNKRHVHIDLENYKIKIAQKDFFIAVEWIKIPYNERNQKVKVNGQKVVLQQFSPFLSYKVKQQTFNDNLNDVEIWQQNYMGKWLKLPTNENRTLLISAKIKY